MGFHNPRGRVLVALLATAAVVMSPTARADEAFGEGAATTRLGFFANVGLGRNVEWPQASIVASLGPEGDASVVLGVCASVAECRYHRATLGSAALHDEGGMNRPITLSGEVDGVGAISLTFRSAQLGNQAFVGCSGRTWHAAFTGSDVEAGGVSGTIGPHAVTSTGCAGSGRDSVLAYAFAGTP